MRALLGLLAPSSGEALVDGQPPVAMSDPLLVAQTSLAEFTRSAGGRLRVRAARQDDLASGLLEIGASVEREEGGALLVLGVLVITTEFRHGPASSTFLASPRRYPALLAKLGIALLIGLLAGLAYLVVNGGLAPPLFESRRGGLPPFADVADVYAGVVASFALICAFGLGVGAIVRSQVGAIITAITFFFVVSSLPELLPGSISDYFPAQALGALQGGQEGTSSLGQVSGGLVLAAWSAALVAIGIALICRRDVAD